MNPDVATALIEFQQEITAEIDAVVKDLTTELEIADIELIHGTLSENQ